ncbi:RICIN domain-containing protein [Lentzea sp. NBRC 102530]|uniref:RICIN domain-containing protein n=1 Tax=Lentzea sp. NBRC 102530 TaxID=3032201 RepID=UPI0025531F24|nr:RICIN domain-containing protein [Lentzea sp. NBRC 102530]
MTNRLAAALFAAALALTGAVQTANAADAGVRIKNLNSGRCALAQGGADNQPVVQYQCLDFVDQKWVIVDKGNRQFQIRNENSGKCMLVRGTDNNAPVVQFTCLDFADQYWTAESYPDSPSGIYLRNVNSQKCLLVRGTADLQPFEQFECARFPDQAWIRSTF